MKIVDFSISHITEAQRIALSNYNSERNFVFILPHINTVPNLASFAENGLGVAAFEDSKMIGFLCCVSPFERAFRSTDAVGVFSPMGANGAIGSHRASVYAHMYQSAGAKWAKAGASSHAVCLYAHDREIQEQFFRYGFGMRTVDAIRGMDEIEVPACNGYDFAELDTAEFLQILPLDHMLDAHMAKSPCFMLRPSASKESFMENIEYCRSIYFAARYKGKIVAYILAELDGETFICDQPGYFHVKGAFCMPEHRGKGVYQNLLHLLIQKLRVGGYSRLGVDFESINPAAYGFWLKYFSAYTHGVVRRIDEHVLLN